MRGLKLKPSDDLSLQSLAVRNSKLLSGQVFSPFNIYLGLSGLQQQGHFGLMKSYLTIVATAASLSVPT